MALTLANIAIPVVFPQPLLALLVLLPVAGVEAWVLRREFGIPFRRILEANLISTLAGIPLALIWIGLWNWVINSNTGGWGTQDLISRASLTDPDSLWVLSAFVVGVIVPGFIFSVLLEGFYLSKRTGIATNRSYWHGLIMAHFCSYLVLLLANCLWFAAKAL